MEKLVSWDAVSSRLEAAKARAAEREKEEQSKNADYEDDDQIKSEAVELYLDGDSEESED